ncbi:hypothetical protein EASAB2608_01105 [Streptomyces sp. EAS-AB2608]|uniref:hypothetical protein n=1 Tax=Streptomyces sp. EAS-AB2608 TaxID=2779671 RepID=UPI001BEE67E5|nr:hypothetical protein [Streptomyces sp. EAS-AB2608]BCM65771.1 hypothetical protein EASAB2608_01105 [Streptomyces sp. EAS-AB2608]
MNEIIPPTDDKGRAKLERDADALLEAAGDEAWDDWPDFCPRREESEFDRIAAAYTGLPPLVVASLCASLPDYDPEAGIRAMRDLMQTRPGVEPADPLSEILDGTTDGTAYGCGFTLESRNFPPEGCRWDGCNRPLYAPGAARKGGRPRKYCGQHQKAAKARTRRQRYAGISVGKNRNLVYDFDGLEQQDLSGYRELWGRVNTARA